MKPSKLVGVGSSCCCIAATPLLWRHRVPSKHHPHRSRRSNLPIFILQVAAKTKDKQSLSCKRAGVALRDGIGDIWLGDQDSNLDKVRQRHLTYH